MCIGVSFYLYFLSFCIYVIHEFKIQMLLFYLLACKCSLFNIVYCLYVTSLPSPPPPSLSACFWICLSLFFSLSLSLSLSLFVSSPLSLSLAQYISIYKKYFDFKVFSTSGKLTLSWFARRKHQKKAVSYVFKRADNSMRKNNDVTSYNL